MDISNVMNSKIESIGPMDSTKEAARKMHDLHIGALIVLENGELQGIITDRDICCKVTATGRHAVITKVHEVMNRDVATCYIDQELSEAAEIMSLRHIRRLAVMNRNNTLAGFLSVDDIAHYSHDLASNVLVSANILH